MRKRKPIVRKLNNKSRYQHFYKYQLSDAINIYSNQHIFVGDIVVIDTVKYQLGANIQHSGMARPSEYKGVETFFYQFTIKQVK